jgi:hypothetical protein
VSDLSVPPNARRNHLEERKRTMTSGLLWASNGGRLLELHRDWAVIDVP